MIGSDQLGQSPLFPCGESNSTRNFMSNRLSLGQWLLLTNEPQHLNVYRQNFSAEFRDLNILKFHND